MFHSSKSRRFFSLIFIIVLLSFIYGANLSLVSSSDLVLVNPFESKAYQYKMQPHVHSTESDGEYSPTEVVTMMRDVGYDIVALTDHLTVTPDPMVPDVVFVSGEETTYWEPEPSMIVLGISTPVTGSTPQEQIDSCNEQGGVSFLESPNAEIWGWTYEEVSSVNNYTGIEIFNSCYAHVQEEENGFAEDKVDYALSNGRRILLSGGSDYHGTWGESLIGGYIVLNTDITTLTQTNVIDIIKSGNYYVAGRINGTTDPDPPSILDLTTNGDNITILVDKPSTIEFITRDGTISQIDTNVTQATYRVSETDMYVRVKVTYTNIGESYAWSNPIYVESSVKTTNASVSGDCPIGSASYSLTNFGGSESLGTGSVDTIKARTLIRWDLDSIPMGSTIISATMSLYCYEDEGGTDTMTIDAYPLLKPWIEGTQDSSDRNLDNPPSCCWIEYGNNIPWDSEGADAPTDRSFTITSSSTNSGTGWYTFDITEAVQNWISGSWENNGLILISSNEEVIDLKYFTSSESSITTLQPQLVIWYEDTSPPQYFDSSTNSTWAGASVEFRLRWTDNVGLSGYIFSFDNGVGTFANDTWVQWSISSKEDWINVTEVVNSAIGKTIRWKVYANDTSNNWNTSPIYSFVTTEPPPPWPPPSIGNVYRTPVIPNYDEGVVVSATIIDEDGVDQALFFYTQDSSWHNVSMNRLGDFFNATIPVQPYGSLVQYKIYANDTAGYWTESYLYSYAVEDFVAPQVGLSQIPANPQSSQTVKVYANVTEPVNASGVNSVLFSYRVNSDQWWNTTMTFNEELALYESSIPQQQPNDMVEYLVEAKDNAENVNTTETCSYVVTLTGDIDGDGDVDRYDFGIFALAYGSSAGDPNYDVGCDLDSDGDVDRYDFAFFAGNYGKTI